MTPDRLAAIRGKHDDDPKCPGPAHCEKAFLLAELDRVTGERDEALAAMSAETADVVLALAAIRTELAGARAELEKAAKTVFEGFEAGMFVRDVHHDNDPAWAIRLVPYIRALAVLAQDGESGAESVNPGIVQKS